ncbi:MAG: carboxynorspermidine decarboxylase [Salinispira sp.]
MDSTGSAGVTFHGNGKRPAFFRGFDPSKVPSPAFVIDKAAIQYNLDVLGEIMELSGANIILALKGFSMFHLAPQISSILKGTAASSVYEARLGREEFGKEVHVYAPAFKEEEFTELLKIADHIVFNSFSQWKHYREQALTAQAQREGIHFGLRINPEHSEGTIPLYDPCAAHSRFGVTEKEFREEEDEPAGLEGLAGLAGISGLHFHTLCEQGAEPLERTLKVVIKKFGHVLKNMSWINFGGGHHITGDDYNRRLLIDCIKMMRNEYNLTVYIEPGEAIAIHTGILLTTVLDTLHNGMDVAILDASATCHMPDTLEMPYRAEIWGAADPGTLPCLYRLGSQTCLAGDVMGDYSFSSALKRGQRLIFNDMAHYTMVKTTTFNGIPLPAICTFDSRNGAYEVVKTFNYNDFRNRLS